VQDHCEALLRVFEQGKAGETYNIGGGEELTNVEIVRTLCALLDEKLGRQPGSAEVFITFVKDRPGHDFRYAIDATKISTELNWQPRFTFKQALNFTVDWYLANMEWVNGIRSGEYRQWLEKNYNER
jgi:dTDP-glucose 4,6-dehydratase